MYDFLQFAVKAALTVLLILVCIRVWRADLDIGGFFRTIIRSPVSSPLDFIPVREPDALYRGGVIVARVFGPVTIDETNREIIFQEIYGIQGGLLEFAAGREDLEYQRWRIRIRRSGSGRGVESSAPRPGPRIIGVAAAMLGDRAM